MKSRTNPLNELDTDQSVGSQEAAETHPTAELADALRVMSSIIERCERAQVKFREGTSQHSLLRNRIKAMQISSALMRRENGMVTYTAADLEEALAPVESSIHKCQKAQQKYAEGTTQHKRFRGLLNALHIAEALLKDAIKSSGQ